MSKISPIRYLEISLRRTTRYRPALRSSRSDGILSTFHHNDLPESLIVIVIPSHETYSFKVAATDPSIIPVVEEILEKYNGIED